MKSYQNIYCLNYSNKIKNAWKSNISPPQNPISSNISPRKQGRLNVHKNEPEHTSNIKEPDLNNALTYYSREIHNNGAYDLGAKGPTRKILHKVCESAIFDASELKKRKSYSNMSTMSGLSEDEKNKMNADSLLRQLQKERNIMSKLGFIEKAELIDKEINDLIERAEKEKKEEETHLLNDQLILLNKKSSRRLQRLLMELDKEHDKLKNKHKIEYDRLLKQQERTFSKLIEDTQRRAIGKIKKCNCSNWYVCRHNKSASYNTRRPTPDVVNFKRNSERLKKKGQLDEAMMWEDKAMELDDKHQEKWRNNVSKSISVSPWGPNGSIVDKLIDNHKHEIKILLDTHKVETNVLTEKQKRRKYVLTNIIKAEENRLRVQVRKQYLKMIEERDEIAKLEEKRNAITANDLYGILDEEDEPFQLHKSNNNMNNTNQFHYETNTDTYWNDFKERTINDEKWVPPTKHGLDYSDRLVSNEDYANENNEEYTNENPGQRVSFNTNENQINTYAVEEDETTVSTLSSNNDNPNNNQSNTNVLPEISKEINMRPTVVESTYSFGLSNTFNMRPSTSDPHSSFGLSNTLNDRPTTSGPLSSFGLSNTFR